MSRVAHSEPALERRKAVADILARRGDALVVSGLGSTTWDTAAAGDHPGNFYVWGGMGGAAMIGLGLAIAQPARRVVVITGDGEMLMGLGAFATIAVQRVENLAVVVMDNEHYGETGMQPTHTRFGVDLAGMAAAAGFAQSANVRTQAEMDAARASILEAPGPVFVNVKVVTERAPNVLPPRDGTYLKHRFRRWLLGDEEAVR
ncbi:MAG: thiamine pyrophosphate-dependent enzyme [Gammaproteobacteria bacterium]|nr:thiamine pyrophosphate-dependent enzyme [Gammaproteobacteria bacterium]